MRTENGQCATAQLPALSPENLINDILLSDEIQNLRQHLRCMADAYLLTEDLAIYRSRVFCTYEILDNFLSKAEVLAIKERRVA